jgi:hypothetical protein
MLIRGDANNASIELSEQEGLATRDGSEFYRVTFRENEFEASVQVYAFDPKNDGLPKFFGALARDWKGWDGPRSWRSLEGEFELICEHDGIGHATMTATIHSNPYSHGWTGQIRFNIAPGELEGIAAGLNRFFGKNA